MTQEKTGEKKHRVEINAALQRVLEHNPRINADSIELFSEVYYPVATLEIDMTETTFEDFELVPLTVMRFVGAGVLSARDIARLTGLSAGYVQKILDLLMGYGYLDANGLTMLGVQSLKEEKKIAHTSVRQRFQADAITGDLLKLGEQTSEEDLQGKEGTFHVIPHLPHIEGVSVSALNSQLENGDLKHYKRYRGDILNANLDEIRAISCVGLDYVRAYLVKLTGIGSPFVIMYQHDPDKKDYKERFRWLPVRVPEEAAYTMYGFDRSIPCYTAESQQMINDLYRLVCKRVVCVDETQWKKLLDKIHPFRYETMDVSQEPGRDDAPKQISVYLNADSFTKWDPFVLKFLSRFDPVKGYQFTDSRLNGLFMRFETHNNDIRRAAKTYQRALRHADRRQMNTYIRNHLFQKENKSAFDIGKLAEIIEQYQSENKEA